MIDPTALQACGQTIKRIDGLVGEDAAFCMRAHVREQRRHILNIFEHAGKNDDVPCSIECGECDVQVAQLRMLLARDYIAWLVVTARG